MKQLKAEVDEKSEEIKECKEKYLDLEGQYELDKWLGAQTNYQEKQEISKFIRQDNRQRSRYKGRIGDR